MTHVFRRIAEFASYRKSKSRIIEKLSLDLARVSSDLEALRSQMASLEKTNNALLAAARRLEEKGCRPVFSSSGSGITVTEVDGLIFGVPAAEWRVAAYNAFRGPAEPGLLARFKQTVRSGMVVVDVGANIGLYTVEAARLLEGSGSVYSFEPSPAVFSLLCENIQVNGYRESGVVHVYQKAVLDGEGSRSFYIHKRNSGHSSLYAEPGCDEEVTVSTVSLDACLRETGPVDVVKIDAEGSEPLILAGMKETIARSPRIHIFMEFAPEHLRRAGLEPLEFLNQVSNLGLRWNALNTLTGEDVAVVTSRLVTFEQCNLLLTRRDFVQ